MKWILFSLSLLLAFTVQAGTLKVMQFNAENFFDTNFDRETHDYTYLPLSLKRTLPEHEEYCESMSSRFYRDQCLNLDWTDAKVTKKISNMAQMIKSYDETGMGPDILVLQEVENINVLYQLVSKGLGRLGYHHPVLIEGDDSRGIDVGIISKYPVVSSKHHSILFNGEILDTRGILEVTLDVEGKHVVVFANHWPSQNNPVEERSASAKLLAKVADQKTADLIIAVGDFNTLPKDNPNPFRFLKNFTDSETEARKINPSINAGTHHYRGEWSSLDKIFIHKNSKLKPSFDTFEIMVRDFATTLENGQRIPVRFDFVTAEGYSDHLPVKLNFQF